MSNVAVSPSITELIAQFPNAPIIESEYRISDQDFAAQKAKQAARQSNGGAIGVVWLEDNTVALVGRTRIHAGWALPGGTVEKGESYVAAFLREIAEEVGVHIDVGSLQLMVLERRCWVDTDNERLRMDMAVFDAAALPGERIRQTTGANEEGLTAQAFSVNTLPNELIFGDKAKILQSAVRRNITPA